ncbi:hypothetical protein [Aliikangiella maris]|uniref:DUF1302 domain-containing protein n=2 Tax=Aliikangiella maris TaxID=3162458 RepID=A0ABV3MLE8_9GAMM
MNQLSQICTFWALIFLPISPVLAEKIGSNQSDLLTGNMIDQQTSEQEWGDNWDDSWEEDKDWQIIQKLSYSYAYLTHSNSANLADNILNEARYSFKFDYDSNSFKFYSHADIVVDELRKSNEFSWYELNFQYTLTEQVDFKIGRQIITWGTGDLLFLNDLFPKDWQSFFNGRENQYLKLPVDAIRLSYFGQSVNIELAYLPEFTADNSLTGETFSFYLPSQTSGAPQIRQPEVPLIFQSKKSDELIGRVYKTIDGIEWSGYFYDGYFKSPSKITPNNIPGYSKMQSLGASARLPLLNGLFNIETSYYHSKEDSSGRNPLVDNSQLKLLVGYEKEIYKNITLSTQVMMEQILQFERFIAHQPESNTNLQERKITLTARLTQMALQQKLTNTLMLFYSPDEEDYYIRFGHHYRYSDQLTLSGGGNILGGKSEQSFFGQLRDNSNLYLRFEYHF